MNKTAIMMVVKIGRKKVFWLNQSDGFYLNCQTITELQ